jgi:sulfate transport system permease protein
MKATMKPWGAWGLIAIAVLYMGFLIIAPVVALIQGAFQNGFNALWQSFQAPALRQSLCLSLQISLLVVIIQAVFGSLIAWVIVRQDFKGKSILNGILDIPFAISPVVVGYMLLLLFGRNGLLSPVLEVLNIRVAFAIPGMFLATLFVCLPFMIREMVPVIQNLDRQQELAAETLGATSWTIFSRIIFPQIKSALIYGMTLTLARALGEFGAVLVIGGGVQGRTETTTLYIFRALEERRTIDAYTASILLGSFSVLIVFVADWFKRRQIRKSQQSVC